MLQDNVRTFLEQITSKPLLDGQLLTAISLSVGDNSIPHKLGRSYRGWIVVDTTAASSIYSKTSTSPAQTLTLNASVATTVALWVF
jgi:hypothetical protein